MDGVETSANKHNVQYHYIIRLFEVMRIAMPPMLHTGCTDPFVSLPWLRLCLAHISSKLKKE